MTEGELRHGFPESLSDDELAGYIAALSNEIAGLLSHDPELYLGLLQAALSEQSRRLSDRALESSRRATRLSLAIAALSLAVALIALCIAAFGTVEDYRSDRDWQDDQTQILTEIRDQLVDR